MTILPAEALRLAEGAADGCLDDLARMLNVARAGGFSCEGDLLEFLRSVAVSVMEAAAPKVREAAVRDVLGDLRYLCRHAQLLDVDRLWAELGRIVREKYGVSLEPAPAATTTDNGWD